ncbi:hypothetical protein DPMN_076634 [Dreissena polymorpha]|uniref:Uncharacterized protein n=1 Tax=Dreissena polymorpha TaxID=45954 RepID=A0A9D4BMK3_DREPO|nr:hypothetical protein DPMN_076634 [Dreissena polymorpha]
MDECPSLITFTTCIVDCLIASLIGSWTTAVVTWGAAIIGENITTCSDVAIRGMGFIVSRCSADVSVGTTC